MMMRSTNSSRLLSNRAHSSSIHVKAVRIHGKVMIIVINKESFMIKDVKKISDCPRERKEE